MIIFFECGLFYSHNDLKYKKGNSFLIINKSKITQTTATEPTFRYDALHHFSNFDKLIRQIIGVENKLNDGKTYGLQTLKDNVSLLDEETINQVNTMVVEAAHQFVLKKTKR